MDGIENAKSFDINEQISLTNAVCGIKFIS